MIAALSLAFPKEVRHFQTDHHGRVRVLSGSIRGHVSDCLGRWVRWSSGKSQPCLVHDQLSLLLPSDRKKLMQVAEEHTDGKTSSLKVRVRYYVYFIYCYCYGR